MLTTIKIKPAFLNSLRFDKGLKQKLATANACEIGTIERWIRSENVRLTTTLNLAILKSHFGLLEGTEVIESTEGSKILQPA